jgi:predicted GIY-YIG superfamily endonuclease
MVYLIHFDSPISPDHTCQHYIGYTARGKRKRFSEHRRGLGARLTQVANERAIDYKIVRTWWKNGTRELERKLKNQKNAPKLCPVCNPSVKGKKK